MNSNRYLALSNDYQDLIVWQRAITFAKSVYLISSRFPDEGACSLKAQMRRSALAVPTKIAEGQSRGTEKGFSELLARAVGSLCEVETQAVIACELKYVSVRDRDTLVQEARELRGLVDDLVDLVVGFGGNSKSEAQPRPDLREMVRNLSGAEMGTLVRVLEEAGRTVNEPPDGLHASSKPRPDLKEIVRNLKNEAEAEAIARMLEETGWNRTAAAHKLNISYKALLYKIRQYGIRPQLTIDNRELTTDK